MFTLSEPPWSALSFRHLKLRSGLQSWQWLVLFQLVFFLKTGRADNGWGDRILSFTLENDAIAHSDRHYTQGAVLSYLTADNDFPGWIRDFSNLVPSPGLEVGAQKLAFALGQEIHTPEDLRSSTVVEDDTPYAGWLYGSIGLQRRGRGYRDWLVRETLRIDLGVIGPESLAEDTQKTWHGQDPRGWEHQLDFEPGIVLRYHREYLFSIATGWEDWRLDLMPYLGGALGNVAIDARLGSQLRFGYNIPNEFETAPADDTLKWGYYLFGGVEGRFVARNIFLNGSTYRSSHRVDSVPWVGNFRVGLTFVLKRLELTIAHTFLTEEFEGQDTTDSYGTASVTVKF